MRLLFEMDEKNYDQCTHTVVRNSARSIIIKDGKVAMIRSLEHDVYEFPGGGIEKGETPVEAMIRETMEETGLSVIPESVKEFGYVHRIQKSVKDPTERFVQDNFYYLCEVSDEPASPPLDGSIKQASYLLEYAEPDTAIEKNHNAKIGDIKTAFIRDARVLEVLISEGLL